jgi:hypothetical protein
MKSGSATPQDFAGSSRLRSRPKFALGADALPNRNVCPWIGTLAGRKQAPKVVRNLRAR